MKSLLYSTGLLSALFGAACDGDFPNPLRPSATDSPSEILVASDVPRHETRGEKVSVCHATGNQRYRLIAVSVRAEPAHRAHGDARVGEPIPGQPGMIFGAECAATPAVPALSVTSGFVSFTDEPGVVILSGNGFEVEFGWFPEVLSGSDAPGWERCGTGSGCAPGTVVDFGTMVYGVSAAFIVPGFAVIGDVVYNGVFFNAQLAFRGPMGMLPNSVDLPGFGITAPFEFAGRIYGYADQARSGAPVFSLHLVGSGLASADFYTHQGRFYSDTELRYRFEP